MPADPILDAWTTVERRCAQNVLVASATQRVSVEGVARLARAALDDLHEQQVAGLPIAVAGANGPALLALLLAGLEARCPAILLDHTAPADENERVAAQLGARAIAQVEQPWPRRGAPTAASWLRVRPCHTNAPPPEAGASFIKLTSGSTGRARGVSTPSEALIADDHQLIATMGVEPNDRILAAVPITHSYGLSSLAMPALLRGTLLVVPDETHPFAAMTAARRADVTVLPTVPAYLRALLQASRPPSAPPGLRLVIAAGELLSAETAGRFRALYGQPVHTFYGASEAGGIAYDRRGDAAESGLLGEPVEGVTIELDPHAASPPPARHEAGTGVVVVRSRAVATGYHPQPDERLVDGCFRTTDLGRLEDGVLRLLGRVDDVINVKGKKVEPREVEQVLRELPDVVEVVVLGVDEPRGGQRVRAVVATSAKLSEAQLRAHCRLRLAEHKVPRSILVVDRIPRTGRGKVDRRALREDAG